MSETDWSRDDLYNVNICMYVCMYIYVCPYISIFYKMLSRISDARISFDNIYVHIYAYSYVIILNICHNLSCERFYYISRLLLTVGIRRLLCTGPCDFVGPLGCLSRSIWHLSYGQRMLRLLSNKRIIKKRLCAVTLL